MAEINKADLWDRLKQREAVNRNRIWIKDKTTGRDAWITVHEYMRVMEQEQKEGY